MRALLLLLALLLAAVPAAAVQYEWTTTGTYATHELPEGPVPQGETFMVSGSLRGTGNTDVVALTGLNVVGCTVIEDVVHQPSDLVVAWHARLLMGDGSCSWYRVGNYTDTGLGGAPVTVVVAAGNAVSYTMHDWGRDPDAGVWGSWFLPVLFLGVAIAFWRTGAEFPGVVSFFAALGLMVPTPFSSRVYIIMVMALAVVLHHYWGSAVMGWRKLRDRYYGRRESK